MLDKNTGATSISIKSAKNKHQKEVTKISKDPSISSRANASKRAGLLANYKHCKCILKTIYFISGHGKIFVSVGWKKSFDSISGINKSMAYTKSDYLKTGHKRKLPSHFNDTKVRKLNEIFTKRMKSH